jgi:hypothetical protein
MNEFEDKHRNGAGAAVEAAEVPGPTFTQDVKYSRLKELGESRDFIALRTHAKERKEELNVTEQGTTAAE